METCLLRDRVYDLPAWFSLREIKLFGFVKDSTVTFTPLILDSLGVQRVPEVHPASLIPEACSSNVQDTCNLTCSDVGLVCNAMSHVLQLFSVSSLAHNESS